MSSQEFVARTPEGTLLEVLAGPTRASAAEFAPDKQQILNLFAGSIEKMDDGVHDVQAKGFKPFQVFRCKPALGGSWLAAWHAYKMTFKFLCKDQRELEGQPAPKVDFHTLAVAQGIDKSELIARFDTINEQMARMGSYPIYRAPSEDFIVLGWKKREFILDSALTEKQVEAIHLRNEQYMKDVRETYG